jgi:hypothetical protein
MGDDDEHGIDFDAASSAWRANKKHLGNGFFQYRCAATTRAGAKCKRVVAAGTALCTQHTRSSSALLVAI